MSLDVGGRQAGEVAAAPERDPSWETSEETVEEVNKPCRGLVMRLIAEPYPLSEPRSHIPAYMELSGAQVGLPGVGEGENWGQNSD